MKLHQAASPSARMYKRGSRWTDFRKIWYWGLLQKSLQIFLIFGKNMWHFAQTPNYIL